MSRRLDLLSMLEDLQRLLNVPALQEELASHHLVVNSVRILRDHVEQHAFGVVDSTHAEVRLR